MNEKPEISHHESQKSTGFVTALPDSLRRDGGLLLDAEGLERQDEQVSLKFASDGHTVLLPQPTDHTCDPLNWSWTRKHLVLFTVAWAALTADVTAAAGSAIIFPQAAQWHITPGRANDPNAIAVLLNGIGGLIWVPVSSIWGRGPVLFWTTVFGFGFQIGSACSTEYETYYAMRVVSALFLTSGQVISIAFLKDIFFFHERARKIGLWAVLYIASPILDPVSPISSLRRRTTGHMSTGCALDALASSFCSFLCFAWAIGINISTNLLLATPQEAGGYGLSTTTIGYVYFVNIGGVFIGEIFGHFFNDYMARRYSLERTLPLIAVIFGLGIFTTGVMINSVAVTAYALDSYPTVPAELSGWLNFARTVGGFAVGYFQQPWSERVGADASFGTQAAIVAVATIPVIVVHRYGAGIRQKYGSIG
uniref:Major facilitator superfamily (MFS) profile domain-containing protein n=1 Tax=Bionectria ochroleuca TaxID=29856 RepID=A0A8H7TM73_BIOOC